MTDWDRLAQAAEAENELVAVAARIATTNEHRASLIRRRTELWAFLAECGRSQARLAELSGTSAMRVSQVLKGAE